MTRTVLLELERVYNHLHDISAICAGVGFAAGVDGVRGVQGPRPAIDRGRVRPPFPVRHDRGRRGRGRARPSGDADAPRAAARAARGRCGGAGASSSSPARCTHAWAASACSTREDALRLGAVGPAARAAGVARGRRAARARGWRTTAFAPAAPDRPAATSRPASGCARSNSRLAASCSMRCSRTRSRAEGCSAGTHRGRRRAGVGASAWDGSRARVARPSARSNSTADRVARVHLRTASYANWPALAHATAGNLHSRFPPDQQELRALLRLRGPLMFVLLRTLATMRRRGTTCRPGTTLARRFATSTPARATAASTSSAPSSNPLHDLQRHGLDIVASPRHADILLVTGPITTRMACPLQSAYDAMPEPRLVAALGDCALGINVLGDDAELAGAARAAAPGRHPHPRLPTRTRRDRRAPPGCARTLACSS